jgi:hypothetical protein
MKRPIAALVTLAIALALAGCGAQAGHGGSDRPKPPPAAGGGAHQPQGGAQAQQPAPVQGDPSAHNTQEGEVDLHVEWASENHHTPACEWSKNAPGLGHPCESLEDGHQEEPGMDYIGIWEREEHGKTGDVFWLSAQGYPGTKWASCSILWKGKEHGGTNRGSRCSITLTLD